MFFKPSEVINYLVSRGATHTCSTNESNQWLSHLIRITACTPHKRYFERNEDLSWKFIFSILCVRLFGETYDN
jgi:hypothetical protein